MGGGKGSSGAPQVTSVPPPTLSPSNQALSDALSKAVTQRLAAYTPALQHTNAQMFPTGGPPDPHNAWGSINLPASQPPPTNPLAAAVGGLFPAPTLPLPGVPPVTPFAPPVAAAPRGA